MKKRIVKDYEYYEKLAGNIFDEMDISESNEFIADNADSSEIINKFVDELSDGDLEDAKDMVKRMLSFIKPIKRAKFEKLL